MAARMRRRRAFPAVVAGALAAAGLVIPAAASEHLGAATFASFVADDVPTIDALSEIALDVPALGNREFQLDSGTVELQTVDYMTEPSPVSPGLARPAVGAQVEGPGGGFTAAISETLTSLIGAFGPLGSSESTSGAEASLSTVSAPVVVSAEALWTFDALAFTITSTITEVDVGLRGHQAEIDRCAGPVVSDYGTYGKVIGEHNHCGGAYVLELEVGDVVRISGYEAGDYVVTSLLDVPKKNTPVSVLSGADLFLQTCHFTGGQMRLVALTPN
jgi:hypothetical protein